jgi:hypothetical protein
VDTFLKQSYQVLRTGQLPENTSRERLSQNSANEPSRGTIPFEYAVLRQSCEPSTSALSVSSAVKNLSGSGTSRNRLLLPNLQIVDRDQYVSDFPNAFHALVRLNEVQVHSGRDNSAACGEVISIAAQSGYHCLAL